MEASVVAAPSPLMAGVSWDAGRHPKLSVFFSSPCHFKQLAINNGALECDIFLMLSNECIEEDDNAVRDQHTSLEASLYESSLVSGSPDD